MNNINRDSKGKFTRSKKVGKFVVWMVLLSIGAIGAWRFFHPIVLPPITKDLSNEMYAQKIDSLEKSLVEGIHQCEKMKYTESDGLVTFDPTDAQYAKVQGKQHFVNNGELSFGTYQFKITTIQYYSKKFYGKTLTGKEAILIALDDQKSADLTQDILFKTTDGWKNWMNCSSNLKLADQIDAIKKIK